MEAIQEAEKASKRRSTRDVMTRRHENALLRQERIGITSNPTEAARSKC